MSAHELTEYQTHRIDWPDPSSSDRQLADLLENTGRRLRIRWLDTGQAEISTYSWIGVVQFDRYRLHIVPKAAGGNLAVLHMLDYSSGIAALRELPTRRDLATGGTHLRDLVCRLLTITSDTILRQGPARDYITREAALPAVRGRLLADRQVLHRFGQLDQLECRYDEYESDTLDNQILAAGLDLAARTATSPRIRAHARRAAADFAAICDPTGLDPRSAAEQLAYTRHNDHYRAAHLWSLLLLHGGAIQDLYQPGYGQARVFLFDMNRLFEDFVTRLTEHAFAGTDTTVHPQARSRSILIDEDAGRPYAAIVPDLLLARGAGVGSWRRVVDVKYKLYDRRGLDATDIYQGFLYANTLAQAGTHPDPPTTILIHPGTPGAGTRLVVHGRGQTLARLRSLALNIPDALAALTSDPVRRTAMLHQLYTDLTR